MGLFVVILETCFTADKRWSLFDRITSRALVQFFLRASLSGFSLSPFFLLCAGWNGISMWIDGLLDAFALVAGCTLGMVGWQACMWISPRVCVSALHQKSKVVNKIFVLWFWLYACVHEQQLVITIHPAFVKSQIPVWSSFNRPHSPLAHHHALPLPSSANSPRYRGGVAGSSRASLPCFVRSNPRGWNQYLSAVSKQRRHRGPHPLIRTREDGVWSPKFSLAIHPHMTGMRCWHAASG